MEGGPPLLSIILLLGFSAYLAFTETALASVSRNKIKIASERGDLRAQRALEAIDNFDTAITTILICNNIAHISIASIVTVWVTNKWGLSFVTLGTIITTLIVFFACEMLPKSIAKKYSFNIILFSSTLLTVLMTLLKPVSKLLTAIGNAAASHTKSDSQTSVTEDELQDIVEDMAQEGTIDQQQEELITSAIQFGDIKVQNIITPRAKITAIDADMPDSEVLDFIRSQKHTRLPVYHGSIDNITGYIDTRDYMKLYMLDSKEPKLSSLINPISFVHQDTEIQDLLPLMSKKKINLVVVTDKFGGTLGIVTIEDILEELVGEIWDETDVVQTENPNKPVKHNYLEDEK